MSMMRPLDTIIELQDGLERLRRAQAQLGGIPDWMRELDHQYQERKAEIDELESVVESARAERRSAEAVVAEAQEKLKRYQRQINEVTTQREYGALLQEIDTVKSQVAAGEEQGFASLERIESANREIADKRAAFGDLEERYRVELARWEEQKPELAEEARRLRERVEVLRERLPRPYLAQFERLYERTGGRALASIRKIERPRGPSMWHCAICHYNVRPQVLVEIQDLGSLIQCDSCKRILFVEGEGDREEAEAGAAGAG
ncbi:MAG TPA: hypothetical protein VMR44_02085 [Thermoanaerobaculia bacterium]|nr:hypothetical protein [Thermoanaerobaculia bacterium]